jgi:hypothetical protein
VSAYIVDHDHIDALLSFAIEHQIRYVVPETKSCVEIELANATEVGRILLTENERSVRCRYPDCDVKELPGTMGEDAATYKFRRWPARHPLSAMTILKACSGFDYQACETEDYEQSLAAVIVRKIRDYAINRLPGYSESPGWHLCRPVNA